MGDQAPELILNPDGSLTIFGWERTTPGPRIIARQGDYIAVHFPGRKLYLGLDQYGQAQFAYEPSHYRVYKLTPQENPPDTYTGKLCIRFIPSRGRR